MVNKPSLQIVGCVCGSLSLSNETGCLRQFGQQVFFKSCKTFCFLSLSHMKGVVLDPAQIILSKFFI